LLPWRGWRRTQDRKGLNTVNAPRPAATYASSSGRCEDVLAGCVFCGLGVRDLVGVDVPVRGRWRTWSKRVPVGRLIFPRFPALTAFAVTAVVWGRAGVRDLLARMARWRRSCRRDRGPDHLRRGDGLARLRAADAAAPPRCSRRHASDHPIWAVWHLPYFSTVATTAISFRSGTSASSSASPAARSCSLQRHGRQHPRLRGLARPLQPRHQHRRGHRDDPGGHDRLHLCPDFPTRQVRIARADVAKRRFSVPAEAPHRRPGFPAPPFLSQPLGVRTGRERRWASRLPRSSFAPGQRRRPGRGHRTLAGHHRDGAGQIRPAAGNGGAAAQAARVAVRSWLTRSSKPARQ
jgi:hypothetical protein